jgi:prepilin-type N-terminal cleavage/methylation domain-containing protein
MKQTLQKAFTIVEILVVVVILGIISALVLLAINPAKKINLSKDARVKSDISQIVNSLQVYYANPLSDAKYPSAPDGLDTLIQSGELKSLPHQQEGFKPCPATPGGITTGTTYCYVVSEEAEDKAIAVWGTLFSKGLQAWCWDSTTGTFTEKKEGEALPTAENPSCQIALPTSTPTPTLTPVATNTPTPTVTPPQLYVLNVSVGGSGRGYVGSVPSGINSCSGGNCSASFPVNTQVRLVVSPNCSTFVWSGACSGTGDCIITMNSNKNAGVTFNAGTCTLTVSKIGSGTITSSPAGINCGSTCSHAFALNTNVTITATAGSGYKLNGWTNGLGECYYYPYLACTQSMIDNFATTANFTAITSSSFGWSQCYWKDTTGCNGAWDFTMGQKFTAIQNGQIIKLCGYFSGTKLVRLLDLNYSSLASASITSSNNWTCVPITPVNIFTNNTYYIVVNLAGSGGCNQDPIGYSNTCGIINTISSVYQSPSGTFNGNHSETTVFRYGLVDVVAQY